MDETSVREDRNYELPLEKKKCELRIRDFNVIHEKNVKYLGIVSRKHGKCDTKFERVSE